MSTFFNIPKSIATPLHKIIRSKCTCCAVLSCAMLSHFSCVRLSTTLWTIVHQAPLSMGFSRQNTGVGSHFLFQRTFPAQGSSQCLLHCKWILYCLSYQGGPNQYYLITVWLWGSNCLVQWLGHTKYSTYINYLLILSVQFSSVAQSCLTL